MSTSAEMLARRDDEQRGRWADRCDFAWRLDQINQRYLICDRPEGHKGMHAGRIVLFENGMTVQGYGRR